MQIETDMFRKYVREKNQKYSSKCSFKWRAISRRRAGRIRNIKNQESYKLATKSINSVNE